MKKLFRVLAVLTLIFGFTEIGFARDVHVRGYYRKNGTYVAPHYRSAPNSSVRDNWSYKGNINPHTGKKGTNYYRNNPTSGYYTPSYKAPSYKPYKTPSFNFLDNSKVKRQKNIYPLDNLFSPAPLVPESSGSNSEFYKIQKLFQ